MKLNAVFVQLYSGDDLVETRPTLDDQTVEFGPYDRDWVVDHVLVTDVKGRTWWIDLDRGQRRLVSKGDTLKLGDFEVSIT